MSSPTGVGRESRERPEVQQRPLGGTGVGQRVEHDEVVDGAQIARRSHDAGFNQPMDICLTIILSGQTSRVCLPPGLLLPQRTMGRQLSRRKRGTT